METQQLKSLEQYKPALKLAGKAAGWTMLLPALAVYWLFMSLFKLAGATLNWVATSGRTESEDDDCWDEREEQIRSECENQFDPVKYWDRGGFKDGPYEF